MHACWKPLMFVMAHLNSTQAWIFTVLCIILSLELPGHGLQEYQLSSPSPHASATSHSFALSTTYILFAQGEISSSSQLFAP